MGYQPAPKPEDEAERLEKLRSYHILDTAPEESFERITRTVATLLDVPISLVSLVDDARQWFKSRLGLDEPETSRDVSFCAYAIMQEGLFVIPDTKQDDRFRENPLVLGRPQVRFYAGAPLITPDGFKIGTLCALDQKPRKLSTAQQLAMLDLAAVVVDELELRLRQDFLEEEVERRTGELIRAKEEAVLANRAKSNFLSNINHELRTPLNAIIGFSGIIRDELKGPLENPTYKEYISLINRSGEHLLSLIKDILDVSVYESSGKFELQEETVDLSRLAIEAAKMVLPRATESGIEINTDVPENPPALWADPVRLKQILLNLLDNSVKFSEAGTKISLAVEFTAQDGVAIRVSDSGKGMAEGDIQAMTKLFGHGGDVMAKSHSGGGLGLSLVFALTKMHGGEVSIDSKPGEGTTVCVHLPAARVLQKS